MVVNLRTFFLVSVAAAGLVAPAQAQEVGEIVVTAQKRAQPLQDVPVSITALTGDALTDSGVTGAETLAFVTPGLQINHAQHSAVPFLRGIGSQDASAGNEGSVATYIDGVYQYAASSVFFSFNNIDRIEVLKGPQGTLYGRNAVGGLINIITRDPSHDPAIKLNIGYANYETLEGNFYGTVGVSDDLAVDVAVRYSGQNDGFGTNYPNLTAAGEPDLTTGQDAHYLKEFGVRSKWLYTPGDRTRVTAAFAYAWRNSDFGIIRRPAEGAFLGVGAPFVPITYLGDHRYQNNYRSYYKIDHYGASLKIEQEMDWATFQSTTGYHRTDIIYNIDQDDSPRTRLHVYSPQKSRDFSQELQLQSNASEGIQWIFGLFYLNAHDEYSPQRLTGIAGTGVPNGVIELYGRVSTESRAAFAQATVPIGEKLNVTAGVRYTSDIVGVRGYDKAITDVAAAARAPGALAGQIFNVTDKKAKFNKLTWRGAIDYKVNEDILTYFSVSRGFKAGVFNVTRIMDAAAAPETLDAYEVGLKTYLFDRKVRWNSAAFYYDDKNIQLRQTQGASILITNAANGTVYGFESELSIVPTRNLTLIGGVAYVHGRYDTFLNAPNSQPNTVPPGGNTVGTVDASGNRYLQSPTWTYNLGGTYSIPLGDGKLAIAGHYSHNSGFFWEANNRLRQKAYGVFNGSISWAPDERWEVRLWTRNLFNENYATFGSTSPTGDQVSDSEPRRVGVTVGLTL